MEKLTFNTRIQASPEKVWDVLWDHDHYRAWTAVFSEGSHAETDWQEGSKVLFVNDKGSGMVSRVAERKDNRVMIFQHLGMVKDGVEDTQSDEVKPWSGGLERYFLEPSDGFTNLRVELDAPDDFKDYFTQTFPAALNKVKELAEKQ